VQDILEIVPLYGLLAVEKFEEFLHELRSHVDLEGFYINGLVDD